MNYFIRLKTTILLVASLSSLVIAISMPIDTYSVYSSLFSPNKKRLGF